ncbi:MAG: type II toxin-antitoxin system PemK/MazF family toxin [candidate division KSB1 bacterium]
MEQPKRGEIWLVDFNPARGSEQAGQRPAVIVQNNVGNRVADTTIIAALSTNLRPNPTSVLVKSSEKTGLDHDSMIKASQLLTLSKSRLLNKLGEIEGASAKALNQALKKSLALD